MNEAVMRFVDRLKTDIYSEAPADLLYAVSMSGALMTQIQAFGDDIRDGLEAVVARTGTVEGLDARLKSRKTEVLKVATTQHYTLEKLIAKFSERVIAEARRLAGG